MKSKFLSFLKETNLFQYHLFALYLRLQMIQLSIVIKQDHALKMAREMLKDFDILLY